MANNSKDLWVNVHSPKTLYDLKSVDAQRKEALTFVNSFATPIPIRKVLLMSGPPGCGKTTLSELIAEACKIQSIKINCSSNRSLSSITGIMGQYLFSTNENNSKFLIIMDELDGQEYKSKVYEYLEKALQYSINPIIATCNDSRAIPMNFMKERCQEIKFRRPYDSAIRNHLYEIATKEGFKFTTEQLDKLIIKGDFRASIFALQIFCMSGYVLPQIQRDRNIFSETQGCLNRSTEISPKIKVEDLINWIEENGHELYAGIDRYHFYNLLAIAETKLFSYQTKEAAKIIGNISYAKSFPETEENRYIEMKRSAYITHFSMTKNIRAQIKTLSLKMAPYYSCSSEDFYDYIFPIIQRQAIGDNNYAKRIFLKYELTKEELALILDCTMKDPRINKISKIENSLLKMSMPTPDQTINTKSNLLDIFS